VVLTVLNFDAAALSSALYDPDTDLPGVLTELAGDLAKAAPFFLGLGVTVVMDGVTVSLTAVDPHVAVTPAARLELPLPPGTFTDPSGSVVFYAHRASALAGLGVGAGAVTVGVLPAVYPVGPLVVTGLEEFTTRNQAIGVLLDEGRTPGEARTELLGRAERRGTSPGDTAQDLLDTVIGPLHTAPASPTIPDGRA
jgi:hypothetical protein